MGRLPEPWRPSRLISAVALVMTDGVMAAVYATLLATAAATVASTVVLVPIAAAVTWLVLVLVRHLARVERSRFAALGGVVVPAPDYARPQGNLWDRFVATVRNGDRWREVAYMAVQSVFGFVTFGAALLAIAPPAAVIGWAVTDGWHTGRRPSLWVVEQPYVDVVWIAVVTLAGLWLLLGVPLVLHGLRRADLALANRLLTPAEIGDPRRAAVRAETQRVAAISAAEDERRRIERDLHDGAQQRLIAVGLSLGQARAALPDDPQRAKTLVDHSHEEVKAVMADLRDLVRGLRPVILEDRGLDAAVSALVARCGFPVTVDIDPGPDLPTAVGSAAYFAISESLTNAMRHAKPRNAWVTVKRHAGILAVDIVDDGRGGATIRTESTDGTGTGLAGLADRAAAIGGSLNIVSPPGGPTRVHLELPCES